VPVPLVLDREAIAELCRRRGVSRLAVFGSAVCGDFDPDRSDVDFLVEFAGAEDGFTAYFALKEDLETLLSRPVDLVMPGALENPYFAASVTATAEDIYAA
jgi:predicted nucleotidyltransferase